MKSLQLIPFFTVVLAFFSSAQSPQYKAWDNCFGGLATEGIYALRQTHDNGYIIGGITNTDSSGNVSQHGRGSFDYWLVKIKSDGSYEWDKRFGSDTADYLTDVIQTTDNGYLIVGYTKGIPGGDMTSQPHGDYDFWVVKTDSMGNKIWDQSYGGSNSDQVYSVCETHDGGYLLGGISFSSNSGNVSHQSHGVGEYWILKIDSQGNILWNQLYGGTEMDELHTVILCYDGGFLLAGYSESDSTGNVSHHNHGTQDFWILKTDSLGNILWDKVYGGSFREYQYSALQSADSGFVIFGETSTYTGGDISEISRGGGDYWLLKIDSIGNKIWDHRYGGNDDDIGLGYVSQTSDRGYLMSGSSYSNSSGDKSENNLGWRQGWMMKTDSLGAKMWDKTILTNGYDYIGLALESDSGCYTFGIETFSDSAGYVSHNTQSWDCFLVKFCDQPVSNSELVQTQSQIFLFPNPVTDNFEISLPKMDGTISIYDALGKNVFERKISANETRLEFLKGKLGLRSGIYFVKVFAGENSYINKIVMK